MALLDVCAPSGDRQGVLALPLGSLGNPLDVLDSSKTVGLRVSFVHTPGWPVENDVKTGVLYGPTKTEYTGTYSGGTGGTGMSKGRVVNAGG